MNVIWSRIESSNFQVSLKYDVRVWAAGLGVWKAQIDGLQAMIGTGPNSQLSGAAWNAARTLFVQRILPIVQTGLSACSWIQFHLDQYASFEAPLVADDTYLNMDAMQRVAEELRRQLYDLTHTWILPIYFPGPDTDDQVIALSHNIAVLEDAITDLRVFNQRVSGMFDSETALARTIADATRSIGTGTLSSDGTYSPAPGDKEAWIDELAAYDADHPYDPQDVFGGLSGQYGGDQGSLANSWPKMTPEQQQEIRDIIHRYYPDLNDKQIADLLSWLNRTGCGYVADVNSILQHYANDPAGFRKKFGFNLYNPDGTVNFNQLLLDFWCYVQSRHPHVDPTGAGRKTPDGIFPTGDGMLKDYLQSHGITVSTTRVKWATFADYDQMRKTGTVTISVNPLILHNMDGTLSGNSGAGAHAMVVTGEGADPSGRRYLIVSSWGDQYKIYPGDYGPGLYYDYNGDGQLDKVTGFPYFTMEGISYE